MNLPSTSGRFRTMVRAGVALLAGLAAASAPLHAQSLFRYGFEPLQPAPEVRVLRDDRVATLEIDYDADDAWGQWWTMDGSGTDPAGFRVTWWTGATAPLAPALLPSLRTGSLGCLGDEGHAAAVATDVRWLVTGNRRVQLQPLANGVPHHLRVERVNALGEIVSYPRLLSFDGGDAARVDALRAQMTYFDDFNRPLGAADEKLWNNATVTSTDARFNLFFINDQFHAHTLNGTRRDHTGDKSQTAQRFRKPLRIEPGTRRRIVFDMDSPLSPRSVWYLDLNPVSTDLTGHADFFDMEGATGLPAGMLRLRAQGQHFSVNLIDMNGASHPIASVDMEAAGRQAVPNVRRSFEARVGTDGVEVLIDGRSMINANYGANVFAPGDYELLWVGFGYNTPKDAVPYFLLHWDNFGFDGPVVEPREIHNYVTRIAGTDYEKANRGNAAFPTYTVAIPDDLRPVVAGATAQAWLVLTYQMGDYSWFTLAPGDHVRVNGTATFPLPPRINNSVPNDPDLLAWGMPHTVRIKLGDLVQGGASPLRVGDNTFQFFIENSGILNVHVEVLFPPGSAPAYTPPSAIHAFPLHAQLPKLGLPARFEQIGAVQIEQQHLMGTEPAARIPVAGLVPLNFVVGNRSYANWAPQLMLFPVASTEVWSTGGTAGIATVEVFVRRVGTGSGPGERVLLLDTMRDVPAPQGRYSRPLDTTAFANGDYEIFVQATAPGGLKSHPSYGNEVELWDAAQLSGAYYPIQIRIQN
ncbi:hypothetical protein [Tahibacter sp.]|uniref:hypothetical protein n=1 Tax=Tahibacter sp. TaxID=2056211 RepID=UPI0028C40EF8|nr:hypothetical protein [Tahibacter sp.]